MNIESRVKVLAQQPYPTAQMPPASLTAPSRVQMLDDRLKVNFNLPGQGSAYFHDTGAHELEAAKAIRGFEQRFRSAAQEMSLQLGGFRRRQVNVNTTAPGR